MRVMLVDDSKTIRRIQRSILEQLGCTEIEEAWDGQDALSRVAAFEPTLILLEYNLPNLDGIGFLRAFRARDTETPVMMVTSEAQRGRVIEAIRSGATDYIIKPFTPDLLKDRIEKIIGEPAPES